MKINKCDFSYFCAVAAPMAPADRFRTLCDWGNWVSVVLILLTYWRRLMCFARSSHMMIVSYDDANVNDVGWLHLVFDNGELRDQPEESQKVMDRLMAPMLDQEFDGEIREDRLRIVQVHDSVVKRIRKVSWSKMHRSCLFFFWIMANWNPRSHHQAFKEDLQQQCNLIVTELSHMYMIILIIGYHNWRRWSWLDRNPPVSHHYTISSNMHTASVSQIGCSSIPLFKSWKFLESTWSQCKHLFL